MLIPLFVPMSKLGLVNSYLVVTIPLMAGAFRGLPGAIGCDGGLKG
jgi:ABC-type glycerol-3-phosphate transport system permease component